MNLVYFTESEISARGMVTIYIVGLPVSPVSTAWWHTKYRAKGFREFTNLNEKKLIVNKQAFNIFY